MRGEIKHTPGPWSIDAYGAGQRIVATGRRGFSGCFRIADAHFSGELARCASVSEMQANARLIAAAPDLLEAARLVFKLLCTHNRDDQYGARLVLSNAIAKATGAE